mmetsp:Transcript_28444/g.13161  ORF Transcript_28444/g.13161 Transcript_28444/m.13161 type:complete len:114 (-) Transcript_28444:79-420(-)
MLLIIECYTGGIQLDERQKYYVSPLLAPDHILKQFPKITILTGSEDPLLDDSWRFLKRLKDLGRDIYLKVLKGYPHGWLSYDVILGMEEARCSTLESVKALSELLRRSENELS